MKPKKKIKDNKIAIYENININFSKKLFEQHFEASIDIFKEFISSLKKLKDIEIMQRKILSHNSDIWLPETKCNFLYGGVKLNTWFTINESISENVNFKDNKFLVDDKEDIKYKCKRIRLDLNEKQKQTINIWLNAYLDMYNMSLKYIKENLSEDKKVLQFFHLRKLLETDKNKLVKKSGIKVHDIDYAIKLACQNYKSALTNFRNGYIKHFRIRYWNKNKKVKLMDLELADFNDNTIRKKVLGSVIGYYNGKRFNFDSIISDCRLQKNEGNYYLYVPDLVVLNEYNNKSKQITIDPGIRTFGTGITENKIVKIGEKAGTSIKEYLLKKDKIMNNANIDVKIKKKNEKTINKKITNLVNELHWKTINYLTKNYETILIGSMSSKSIVSKKNGLNRMTKRIALHLNFNKFHQRLKFKCNMNGSIYGKINEWMTSKMCSNCSNIHENLGSSEMYECSKCKIRMERDINGARNIYIKAIRE
jgi:transposase